MRIHRRAARINRPYTLFLRVKKDRRGRGVLLNPWQIRFTTKDADGKTVQVRKSLGTYDESEARVRAAKIYQEHATPTARARGKPTLLEAFQQYQRHTEASLAPETARNYRYILTRFFEQAVPAWRTARIDDVHPRTISSNIDQRRTADGLKDWSAYDIRKALFAFFSYCCGMEYLTQNPVKAVKKIKPDVGMIDYLRQPEIAPLLGAIRGEDSRLHGPVCLAILAGLRLGEICSLTWEDVLKADKLLSIRSKVVEGLRLKTKTRRDRKVPIFDDLGPILEDLPRKAVWVCPSPCGKRWNGHNLGKRLKRFMDRYGRKATFQTFRHTFGSLLAQANYSLYQISEMMGNSEEVCRKHYAALAVERIPRDFSFLGRSG